MTSPEEDHGRPPGGVSQEADDSPEQLPPKAWVTLIGFAVFVVLFGTCASTFMFN